MPAPLQMQIRGRTQIKDLSLTLLLFYEDVQALFTATQDRLDFVGTEGQDEVSHAGIDPDKPLTVFRNGVILQADEFLAGPGLMLFQNPVLEDGEQITVLVGYAPAQVAAFVASAAPPLPTALTGTDRAIVLRDGLPYLLPVTYLGFTADAIVEPGILDPGILE
jgi:hypothetical protein